MGFKDITSKGEQLFKMAIKSYSKRKELSNHGYKVEFGKMAQEHLILEIYQMLHQQDQEYSHQVVLLSSKNQDRTILKQLSSM